jgi:hypothetical protein
MRSSYAAIPSHVDPLRQYPFQAAADKKRQGGFVATVLFVVLFSGKIVLSGAFNVLKRTENDTG